MIQPYFLVTLKLFYIILRGTSMFLSVTLKLFYIIFWIYRCVFCCSYIAVLVKVLLLKFWCWDGYCPVERWQFLFFPMFQYVLKRYIFVLSSVMFWTFHYLCIGLYDYWFFYRLNILSNFLSHWVGMSVASTEIRGVGHFLKIHQLLCVP